jgi:hypothetical protein
MNFNFYLFGTPHNNFDQFSSDDSRKLFERVCTNPKSKVQLVIYRCGSLVYYCYLNFNLLTKNNREGACLGMNMVLNGVSFLDERAVLTLFDDHFNVMVHNGKVIKQNANGKVVFTVDRFYKEAAEIKKYEGLLRNKVDEQFIREGTDYLVNKDFIYNHDYRVKIISYNGDIWNTCLDTPNTTFKQDFSKDKSVEPFFTPNRIKWASLFLATIFAISIISFLLKANNHSSSESLCNDKIIHSIEGSYVGDIEKPYKIRVKIEISGDSSCMNYLARFFNYKYGENLLSSRFNVLIKNNSIQIHDVFLGDGIVTMDSLNRIVINSLPDNKMIWNMQKCTN